MPNDQGIVVSPDRCPRCGYIRPSDTSFCPRCGGRFSVGPAGGVPRRLARPLVVWAGILGGLVALGIFAHTRTKAPDSQWTTQPLPLPHDAAITTPSTADEYIVGLPGSMAGAKVNKAAIAEYVPPAPPAPARTPPIVLSMPASPTDLSYAPSRGWQTRARGVVCHNYFRADDAEKAQQYGDSKWLADTGCFHVPAGLKVIPVKVNNHGPWQVRIYDHDKSYDAYMHGYYIVGFINAGTHKSEKDAQAVLARLIGKYKKRNNKENKLPYYVEWVGPSHLQLWLGPGHASDLQWFCEAQETPRTAAQMLSQGHSVEAAIARRRVEAEQNHCVPPYL